MMPISIFMFLTATYYISRYFLVDKNKEPKGMASQVLSLFYFILVIVAQLIVNVKNSTELCNGTPQVVSALIYTVLPNFFILGLIILMLTILPGWKAPFSNTIGYLVVYMLGVKNVFTDLLKTKGSPLVQKIYDNQSLIINEITPTNFDAFLLKMNQDKLLKPNYKSIDGYKALWEYVVIKDSISEFMWIILTGALVISTTYNALLEITCDIPSDKRKSTGKKFETQAKLAASNKQTAKLFTVHD